VNKHSGVVNGDSGQYPKTFTINRFHVQLEDGRQLVGAAAFVAVWLVMPGWRWLGRMGRLPGVTPVLELAYRAFLRLRPYLQRWAQMAESTHRR
jgi:predicted DCC family thiol-disulfide oxidoreductase YuxK